ncbi:hypothetical protein, partial [Streptomyces rameus]
MTTGSEHHAATTSEQHAPVSRQAVIFDLDGVVVD